MTNFEKVKELLTIEDMVTNRCKIIHRLRNEDGCIGVRTCEECRKWLAEEYVEHITLTEVERVILENIDKSYKYIASDKDGSLYIFNEKPIKTDEFWEAQSYYCRLEVFEHLFKFILWEDDEPYEIAKLLEG